MKITEEIDVRGLPPPEPFEKIIRALEKLPADAELQVLIHREPYPLYEVLLGNGYTWQTTSLAEDNFKIIISKSS